MRLLSLDEVARHAGCELRAPPGAADLRVSGVTVDSRRLTPPQALFFALRGQQTDGHRFVAEALDGGCLAAVVSASEASEASEAHDDLPSLPDDTPLLLAPDSDNSDPVLAALERLATWWRGELSAKVLGITGSNGKTTVKAALQAVLGQTLRVAASPGSYNSRLGVALSLLAMPATAEIALLEAGVSAPGDMAPLRAMIRPELGLLTGIGSAHLGAFGQPERIAEEKLQLFNGIGDEGWLLVPEEGLPFTEAHRLGCPVWLFGQAPPADLVGVTRRSTTRGLGQLVRLHFPDGAERDVELQDSAPAQLQNLAAAASAAWLLGLPAATIASGLDGFRPPPQRMETWHTAEGVTVINDCYSSDPTSADSALRALASFPPEQRRIFAFGGMAGLGAQSDSEHAHVGRLAAELGVQLFAGVGERARPALVAFEQASAGEREGEGEAEAQSLALSDPGQAASQLSARVGHGDVVLVKGPSEQRLDSLARALVDSSAPTRLIIDLTRVEANLRQLRSHLGAHVKLCPIVKAAAYGGDPVRLCRFLERVGVDHLGVAFAEEGAALRRAGISCKILVLSPGRGDAQRLVRHRLTPVIHSADGLSELEDEARRAKQVVSVHLKVDTGMGRYGFFPDEALGAARQVDASEHLSLEGVMTHFAAAEDPEQDAFTQGQIDRFSDLIDQLRAAGINPPLTHAAATSAALRFPAARFDMVRIGLGLYGIPPSPACAEALPLELAVAAVSRISSIKHFPAGHSIGYGRRYTVTRPEGERIAFIPCGYHDAIWRDLYRGGGEVVVRGKRCPIVGTVSMDSAPIDVSGVPEADIGDDVLLFGEWQGQQLPPEEVAARGGTVSHELLSGIGARVQRIYQEG